MDFTLIVSPEKPFLVLLIHTAFCADILRHRRRNNFKGLHDRLERLETALEKLSTSNAARSNKSQAIGPVPALAEFGKPWTETAAYVERDPSFERQSLMAGQFMELAVPSGSPAVANQFKALNDAVATPESDTSTTRQKIRSATGAVQMDHVPANFVLQLIRYLSCKDSRDVCDNSN